MRLVYRLLCMCFLSTAFLSTAFAHNIMPARANAPNTPAEIVGLMSSSINFAELLRIRNVSDKVIVEVQVGRVVESPAGCMDHPFVPVVVYYTAEATGRLKPGDAFETYADKLDIYKTIQWTKPTGSRNIFIQFGVVFVRFADGTTWSFDLKRFQSFDEHQSANRVFNCSPENMKNMDEASNRPLALPGTKVNDKSCAGQTFRATENGPVAPLHAVNLGLDRLSHAVVPMFQDNCSTWVCLGKPLTYNNICTKIVHPPPLSHCNKDTFGACCS